LYLRGGVVPGYGDWSAADATQLNLITTDDDPLKGNKAEASQVYSLKVEYPGGTTAFKVADADWGGALGYNYGANADNVQLELGVPLTLYSANSDADIGDSKDINVNLDAGTYIFAFEDGVTKTMTVTAKEQ
jgi:pullulanase